MNSWVFSLVYCWVFVCVSVLMVMGLVLVVMCKLLVVWYLVGEDIVVLMVLVCWFSLLWLLDLLVMGGWV